MGGRSAGSGLASGAKVYDTLASAEAALGFGNGGAADQWASTLSKKEIKAMQRYGAGSWYQDFNKGLRQGAKEEYAGMNKSQIEVMNRLDAALDRSELDTPMVMSRASRGSELYALSGIDVDDVWGSPETLAEKINRNKGSVLVDNAFTSSTAKGGETSWVKKASARVVYHIKTPAGKGIGGYIGGVLGTNYFRNDVTEFLFNRGSGFRIDSASVIDGLVHVNTTYVGRQKPNTKYVTWDEYWKIKKG